MEINKYITNLTKEEVENNVIISCLDEKGNHSILIKNSLKKIITSNFDTDHLNFQFDSLLKVEDKEFYFHIITCKNNDCLKEFNIINEYIFKKIVKPISGNDFAKLISSLEEFFKITPDKENLTLQIGVFGELLTIKFLYESGYEEILKKYHKNFYSKHDIEIDEKTRIEIKTTISEKRIHNFKHNQICRNDAKVFLISNMLEQSQEGYSLFQLFEDVLKLYNDPDSVFELKKLMKRCNIDEKHEGIKIAYIKAINDLKIFDTLDLPKINGAIPNTITNINYDVDCSFANDILVDDFIKTIKK